MSKLFEFISVILCASLIVGTVTFCVMYSKSMQPTKFSFTVLDKEDSTRTILTTSDKTVEFDRENGMSAIQYQHAWKLFEINKSYICDAVKISPSPFTMEVYRISNCQEIL